MALLIKLKLKCNAILEKKVTVYGREISSRVGRSGREWSKGVKDSKLSVIM